MADFENTDFERTDKSFAYRPWTLTYIWNWGRNLMTSFRNRVQQYYEWFTPLEREQIASESKMRQGRKKYTGSRGRFWWVLAGSLFGYRDL